MMPAQFRRHLAALAAAVLLPAATLAAPGIPILVADLAPGSVANEKRPAELAAIGGLLYYAGSDEQHGAEPWVSDGTAAGTRRLADLCPGPCGSFPASFTALGERVIFATQPETLHEGSVYAVAGGEVEEIGPGLSHAGLFVRLGPILYFAASSDSTFEPMQRTDGTAAGTFPTRDFCLTDGYCGIPVGRAALHGKIYFTQDGGLYALRPEGPGERLATLASLHEAVALDDRRVVFRGCIDGYEDNCWAFASDGTRSGTRLLGDGLDPLAADPRGLVAWRGRIYFRNQGGRIASTDGTAAGTRLEGPFPGIDNWPFAANAATLLYLSRPAVGAGISLRARRADGGDSLLEGDAGSIQLDGEPARLGEKIFFTADARLMATDGTPAGTAALATGYLRSPGVALGNAYYFGLGRDQEVAGGLWRSDGSAAGTARVELGLSEPLGTRITPHALPPGLVAEVAAEPAAAGDGLYRVDPGTLEVTPADLRPLKVLAAGETRLYANGRGPGPRPLVAFAGGAGGAGTDLRADTAIHDFGLAAGDRLYFADVGSEAILAESDGTAAGTRDLFDLRPGYLPPCTGHYCQIETPERITPSGDRVFFKTLAVEGSGVSPVHSLWAWRPGQAGPTEVHRYHRRTSFLAAIPGGRAVFSDFVPETGAASLWISDGTPAGTRPFAELPTLDDLTVSALAGQRLFFSLPTFRPGLWVTDFTAAGTFELLVAAGISLTEMAAAGDGVFFAGKPGIGQGRELGFSDGTPEGTRWLDLRPGSGASFPQGLFALDDGRVVFAAAGDAAGNELWLSDGTADGSRRLTDLAPGADASSPSSFAQAGGRLFFRATDGASGFELWALDLPPDPAACPADRLCLQNGRFEVAVQAFAPGPDGALQAFPGQRALGAAEAGIFTFFSPGNWELLVKVLDACPLTGSYWVFAAAASDVAYQLEVKDRATGRSKTYSSAAGAGRPIIDTGDFFGCAADPLAPAGAKAAPPAALAPRCADDGETLCLGAGGRFRVALDWRTATGEGRAQPVAAGSADSGLFTFFSPSNWEMMVKVLDGCAINGRFWVFAAGTTDVGWTLTVTDRNSSRQRVYRNALGQASPTIADSAAFACAP